MTAQLRQWPASDPIGGDFTHRLADVVETVKAGAAQRDSTRSYAVDEVEALRRIGFWALTVPVEFGGLGGGARDVVDAVLALAGADGSLGQIPQNHFMTVERIRLTTSGSQRAQWLGAVGSGAVLGNANAEPREIHPGSHGTTVTRRGDTCVLNGRKVYSTGSLLADHIAVAARDDDGVPTTVLVAADAAGVVIHDDWRGLGQRTTASGSVELHDVRVGRAAVLPVDVGPVATYRVSALGQLLHATIDAGIASAAVDEAVGLARRAHGGRGSGAAAFGEDVLGVAHLGELHITALSARRLVESAADRLDRLTEHSELADVIDSFYEVAAAKSVSTRAAMTVTSELFDIGGAGSTRPSLGLDRYWRDARTHTLHDALRWKPHSIGRWLLDGTVGDPWSIGHPFQSLDELRGAEPSPGAAREHP